LTQKPAAIVQKKSLRVNAFNSGKKRVRMIGVKMIAAIANLPFAMKNDGMPLFCVIRMRFAAKANARIAVINIP